jgi:hypothetical protein
LTGGLYFIFIQIMRGRASNIGDLFIGFQKSFPQLFLGMAVTSIVSSACFLPAAIIEMPKLAPLLALSDQIQHSGLPPMEAQKKMMEVFSQMLSLLESGSPVFLMCMIPWIYVFTNFLFTLPLIIDKEMDFWTAIKTSWKLVHRHWLSVFGLLFMVLLINFGGFCLCCVGVFFTFAFTTAACMFAYETIFGESRST